MSGDVIGVNAQIESDRAGTTASASPSLDAVKSVANTLIAGGRCSTPTSGSRSAIRRPAPAPRSPPSSADTPASKAGLKAGDVITAIDGATVANADDLTAKINAHKAEPEGDAHQRTPETRNANRISHTPRT